MSKSEIIYLILELLSFKQGARFTIMFKAALSLVKYFHSKHFMTYLKIQKMMETAQREMT